MADAHDATFRDHAGPSPRAVTAPAAGVRSRLRDLSATWSLSGTLLASAVAVAAVAVGVLYVAGGWEYYATPLRVRAYAPQHRLLRPSGPLGQALGVAGIAMMCVPVLYSVRKKWRRLSRLGSMKTWLEVHIFCGTVGPILVTFHSSLKFNGMVSIAYWSMVAVMLSGFVGRYLYIRMPRSIRGAELSYDEIVARVNALDRALSEVGLPARLTARLEGMPAGFFRRAVFVRRLRRSLRDEGVPHALVHDAVHAGTARASLLRRLAYLQKTRRLFAMWHMFHQPLVYVMFAVALVHIGVAVYFGYAFSLGR